METFFNGQKLSTVFKLNAGVTSNVLPTLIIMVIDNIKGQLMSDAVAAPRWHDLRAKSIVEKK